MAACDPKEVETAMRAYEVMVILDLTSKSALSRPRSTYLSVVRKDGKSVEKVDVWGRRRLAYEINKNSKASTPSSNCRPGGHGEGAHST